MSHVKEFIHLVDSIQKELNIKIPAERRDVNLHHILMRILVSSFPTLIRISDSSLPVGVRKPASPI